MENIFDGLDKTLEDIFEAKNHDLVTENANVNGKSPVGQVSLVAGEVSKMYAKQFLDKDVLEAFEDGYIHIHDYDMYLTGTTTCIQLPLEKLFKNGFRVGECFIREPQSISTAVELTAIALQSSQNCQHGGQSISNYDFDLAPYVKKSYEKHFRDIIEVTNMMVTDVDFDYEAVRKLAWDKTREETFQAMEGFIHNCNSMLSRNGCQVPFVSVNFGLDTSPEGRLISEMVMKAQEKGLGNGETPIFPILIFKYKAGVNANPNDPNYDLFKQAIKTTSRRLFPNFLNVDAPYNVNKDSDDPRDAISTMGCRTRVFTDVTDKDTPVGRGNLSFTTLNLPMLAQKSIEENKEFMELLDEYIDMCIRQLKQRLEYQKSRKAGNFRFIYENGAWKNGEHLDLDKPIGDALNTGTLSVGFIGLAETLVLLTGQHHGESSYSWDLGYKIIKHIRKRMDEQIEKDGLNWSCLGTPAEGYAGKSVRKFVAKYGVIENVSDREYFTNSNHIPVHYKISVADKIRLEAPFHKLTNAGHICYIELDGEVRRNPEAVETIVHYMMECNVGYGSINHTVDTCRQCGNQGIFHNYQCTKCGSGDVQKVARITGYLTGDVNRWNSGKQAELKDRLKHNHKDY